MCCCVFLHPGSAFAKYGQTSPMLEVLKTAEVVRIGFYPINIYGVNYTNGTFQFDGFVWLVWKGYTDPTATLEFVNAVNKSDLTKTYLFDTPKIQPDGSKYQIMRIESHIF